MEKFAGGAACEADRASVQRDKEGERWKGVPAPQNADGRAGYRMAARTTARRAVIMSSSCDLAIPATAAQTAARSYFYASPALGVNAASAGYSPVGRWLLSSFDVGPFNSLGTGVADPGQGHRLVAGRAEPAGPAVLPVVAAIVARSMTGLDTGLAGTQSLHLLLSGQLWGAQDGAVSPFEMTAIRVMSQSWLGSRGCAVDVHRIDDIPDIWMFHHTRHAITLGAGRAGRVGPARARPNVR